MNAIAYFDPNSSHFKYKINGTVSFSQNSSDSKTSVSVNLIGFPPNKTFAMHIHSFGDLTNGCESAGGHFNPHKELHGNAVIHGKKRHVGDLVNNVYSDRDGKVEVEFVDDLVQLFGFYTVIGRTVVIHENKDDLGIFRDEDSKRGELSRTTGNAGGRVACSVIGVCRKKRF